MKARPSVRKPAKRIAVWRKSRSVSGQSPSDAKPSVQISARADSFLSKRVLLACLFLIAACVIVYAPVRHFGFVSLDDPEYVTENLHVARGLTWQGARWALTSSYAANWHPVTWLSHMLDVQLYGMNAGPQHVTNLLLHILNTLLLFGLLYRMTEALGRSAFVAALFALHPLHVASVVWIAERKDVLSTLFWMLTMWAYVAYVRRPGLGRYLLTLVFFGLGLMAKPMLVTLPFALLLLDFWPLQRVELGGGAGGSGLARLAVEKLPLFALAAASSVVTVLVQWHGGAVASLEGIPWGIRLANAPASYMAYIGKMLWPARLAAFYPFETSTLVWRACLGLLLLIGVTILAIRARRRHGYFLAGWLWYVGALVPVIGLLQVGRQSMADRYTYVPLIGLFVVVAWGAPELAARWRPGRLALPAVAVCVVLACAALARAQVRYWSDSTALWQHELDVGDDRPEAYDSLGKALTRQGKLDEAVPRFVEALRINPGFAEAQSDLGVALTRQGKLDEAGRRFVEALRLKPGYAEAQNNLGVVLYRQGKFDEAVQRFVEALRINPGYAQAHDGLGVVLYRQGKSDEAVLQFVEALRINPDYAEAHSDLGVTLSRQGQLDEAVRQFVEALRIEPGFAQASSNLKLVQAMQRKAGR
jgi:Flp pilus assembly protein TadD